ncbi:MAG: 16S rRNA processing protein RimM [Bdellovibrio sp. CG12_big_fil_rev_8_21_14_0_65_39_13]|nr:MAG: 16S rRNA processing protein RimM [Bdellovibrio sp. CG22_combo_CG10-13_8_21_14_all_39_27]PIQ59929.1 MAG: 16S rRNA processing protein RimM [Bdellovibrio sp. CG12_big_fil_rev_8_21_14_0_65_39_13]PIR34443.1 MAG: 16S rRNA processing protein RimM [Bdellovibrio sp. CG11_big_fil_rev_8_21_14_0_20_39_38]PJB53867.1 MAG: 16S rRNA processing protein RimM [Bdellovibrio sp. CG_4_9_14_3_um_filter_39_7]
MKTEAQWFRLGVCRKPHGIKGGFEFHLDNTEDSVLENHSEIELRLIPLSPSSKVNPNGDIYQIDKISFGNKVIAYLKGVEDRTEVESLIPFEIYIDRKNLPELEDGEVYIQDLLGMTVIGQESGERIGRVKDFLDNGFQIILEIRGAKNFDIPYVDAFIKNIDLDKKEITILEPEYDDE